MALISAYGASQNALTSIQHFLDRCFRRKYIGDLSISASPFLSIRINISFIKSVEIKTTQCRSFNSVPRNNNAWYLLARKIQVQYTY